MSVLDPVLDFAYELFEDWTITGFIVWIVLSLGSIYVSWFVDIPSAFGRTVGFPMEVKFGVSFGIPIITYFLIKNKEWTADTFGKIGKRRK